MSTLAALNGHGFRRPPTPAGVLLRSALPPILMAMPLFEFCIPTTGTKVPSGPEEALLSAPLHQVAAAISKTQAEIAGEESATARPFVPTLDPHAAQVVGP